MGHDVRQQAQMLHICNQRKSFTNLSFYVKVALTSTQVKEQEPDIGEFRFQGVLMKSSFSDLLQNLFDEVKSLLEFRVCWIWS